MKKTGSVLYGHEKISESLCELAGHKMLRHAYLFYGAQGVGKATCALWLAGFLELGEFGSPNRTLIDFLLIEPEKDKSTIGIDSVRRAQEFVWQTPLVSYYRLLIIDQTNKLTPEAQSALLKLVEDPPTRALFIFIADSTEVLMPPLRSRLSKIYFRTLSKEMLENFLVGENKCTKDKAKQVASRSFGRIGRAISLIDSSNPRQNKFADELEERLISLWEKDAEKFALKLKWISERIAECRRYNVNETLQRRAVEHYISQ